MSGLSPAPPADADATTPDDDPAVAQPVDKEPIELVDDVAKIRAVPQIGTGSGLREGPRKKKRKGKSLLARGETALSKNRGTGFEGL